MASDKQPSTESIVPTVIFWLVAFTATALFAAVLIAPRWEQSIAIDGRAQLLATQCRYLDQQNHQLSQVIESLKHDPEFTFELARCELDWSLPGEHRISAPTQNWNLPEAPLFQREPSAWWYPLLRVFAHDRLVRLTTSMTAAVFTLVGLAFFNPPSPRGQEPGIKGQESAYRVGGAF